MSQGGFRTRFDNIQHGEPVSDGITNRPLTQIEQDLAYLYQAFTLASIGTALFARAQTVESGAALGMPVYWNPVTKQFERALASITADPATGVLSASASSQVWGIIAAKTNPTLADILIAGYYKVDLTAAIGGPVQPLVYYLSGQTPGVLTAIRPLVAVPVLRADGLGNVFVMPQVTDLLDRHTHYQFDLVCAPAGDSPTVPPGGHHTITSPDPSLPGWLPASHAIFNGKAPAGAHFGYNFSVEPTLQNLWPPLPISSCALSWNKGATRATRFQDIDMGPTGLAVIDINGIWWMTDCYASVPWTDVFPSSISAGLLDECPTVSAIPQAPYAVDVPLVMGHGFGGLTLDARFVDTNNVQHGSPVTTGFTDLGGGNYNWVGEVPAGDFMGRIEFHNHTTGELLTMTDVNPADNAAAATFSVIEGTGPFMALKLWFTKLNYVTDTAVVSSLRSIDPRLQIVCASTGDPAIAGDLLLSLVLDLFVGNHNTLGSTVLKTFDGVKFGDGFVIEGMYPVTGNVTLISDVPTIPLDPENPGGAQLYQGRVGVGVTPAATAELDIQITRLSAVVTEYYLNTPYLGFQPAVDASYRAQVNLPNDLPSGALSALIQFVWLARGAGVLPAMTLTGRIIPMPVVNEQPTLPDNTAEFTITLPAPMTISGSNHIVQIESASFPVHAGDTVLFTLARSASDSYTQELGVIRQSLIISLQ